MADATPEPQSPLWWLQYLEKQLQARQAKLALFDAYYRGDHPPPFLTKAHNSKMHDEFRQLLDDSRANFMRLVVDAVEERMRVDGFRLSASSDAQSDKASWDIWQANGLDSESQSAFIEALVKGMSYLSVWGGDPHPTIAVEDPSQTIVGYRPGSNYRQRSAALKTWQDDWTGETRANVYLPDGIYKYVRKADTSGNPSGSVPDGGSRWLPLKGDTSFVAEAFVANPLGIVPIIPLRNRPRLLCEGESELADVYRIQNGINGFLFLLALAGYFGAHKQRWAVGLKIMEDQHGKPVEPFDVAIDRLIQSDNQDAKFGEFSATDLTGYIKAIDQKITHIAITTRVPKHYLLPEGQEPSGDALRSGEAGLVKKVERKQRPFGEGLEEAMRLARQFAGEPDSPVDSEIVWASAQTDSAAVVTDAVVKQYAAGLIPLEAAQEQLGYSQTQIARFGAMRLSDVLLRELMVTAAPPAVPVPAPPVAA